MGFLKDILQHLFKTAETMSFYSFYNKLENHIQTKTYPNDFTLPQAISFPEDFWKQVVNLYKETQKDGHERAVSVFLWEDEYIFATIIHGDKSQVSVGGSIRVAYEPKNKKSPNTNYYRKIWIDEKVYSKKEVAQKKSTFPNRSSNLFVSFTHTSTPRS